MSGPRRLFGLTLLGWLNFLILRWFFVRAYYVVEPDGSVSDYGLLRWIWPLPWAEFRFVGGWPVNPPLLVWRGRRGPKIIRTTEDP